MYLEDRPEEAAFRKEVRSWFEGNAQPKTPVGGPALFLDGDSPESATEAKRFQAKLAEAGLAGITWPPQYGGRGGTLIEQVIFQEEAAAFEVPGGILLTTGLALAGPTIMAHGTEKQKDRFLRRILSGEEIWCQLFSEPGAGSDLASLRTRAVLQGDHWVVNGQKVWSSGAKYADWGLLLARTDPDQPKHHGITYFLLDMSTPGVAVRPLRQITGDAHFNEVFLDDVRIPAENILGQLNAGWTITQTTLMNERMMVGGETPIDPHQIIELARRTNRNGQPAIDDPNMRQRIADVYIRAAIFQFLRQEAITKLKSGQVPGPEGSIAKLTIAHLHNLVSNLGLDLQGPAGMLFNGSAVAEGAWQKSFLEAPAVRIGGGTDEIQRNIIGERLLGLPREPDPSRSLTFSQSASHCLERSG